MAAAVISIAGRYAVPAVGIIGKGVRLGLNHALNHAYKDVKKGLTIIAGLLLAVLLSFCFDKQFYTVVAHPFLWFAVALFALACYHNGMLWSAFMLFGIAQIITSFILPICNLVLILSTPSPVPLSAVVGWVLLLYSGDLTMQEWFAGQVSGNASFIRAGFDLTVRAMLIFQFKISKLISATFIRRLLLLVLHFKLIEQLLGNPLRNSLVVLAQIQSKLRLRNINLEEWAQFIAGVSTRVSLPSVAAAHIFLALRSFILLSFVIWMNFECSSPKTFDSIEYLPDLLCVRIYSKSHYWIVAPISILLILSARRWWQYHCNNNQVTTLYTITGLRVFLAPSVTLQAIKQKARSITHRAFRKIGWMFHRNSGASPELLTAETLVTPPMAGINQSDSNDESDSTSNMKHQHHVIPEPVRAVFHHLKEKMHHEAPDPSGSH